MRALAIDLLQAEKPDDFFDRDFLAVIFRRPAEQAEVIAHRFRQKTFREISAHARADVALAHLRAVLVQDQRDVREARRLRAERAIELDVLRRIREMILAADDVGDLHLDVVDHIHEVENPRAVRPADGHVRVRFRVREVEIDRAADDVVHDHVLARRTETERAVVLEEVAARLELREIASRRFHCVRSGSRARNRRRPAGLRPSPARASAGRRRSQRSLRRCCAHASVSSTRRTKVPPVMPREEPVKKRRPRPADVEETRG